MEGLKVLVVDDEPDLGEFLSDALETLGHSASLARDQKTVLKKYSDELDVVILDLFMPDSDGIEILNLLSDKKADAAIIFMSGKDRSILNAAQRLATDQGFAVLGVLQKPFTLDELGEVIDQYGSMVHKKPKAVRFRLSETDILQGLAEGQFSTIFRPQQSLRDETIIGGEVALLWNHPAHDEMRPDRYMPSVDTEKAYNALISFTLTAAVQQLGQWNKQGLTLRLSVRMMPHLLASLNLLDMLEPLLRDEAVMPHQLVLEFPEAGLERDGTEFIDQLTRLRIKGFTLSIGKFGTGNMSLRQLVGMPFNEIKFHRTIVEGMAKDPEMRSFARVAAAASHELGMNVVCAGIRNRMDWDAMADLQCHIIQGELIGNPMSLDDFQTYAKGASLESKSGSATAPR